MNKQEQQFEDRMAEARIDREARAKKAQNWQVVDGALGSTWETEPWGSTLDKVPVLNANQMTLAVVIRNL